MLLRKVLAKKPLKVPGDFWVTFSTTCEQIVRIVSFGESYMLQFVEKIECLIWKLNALFPDGKKSVWNDFHQKPQKTDWTELK